MDDLNRERLLETINRAQEKRMDLRRMDSNYVVDKNLADVQGELRGIEAALRAFGLVIRRELGTGAAVGFERA